jgi:hypothetical protein
MRMLAASKLIAAVLRQRLTNWAAGAVMFLDQRVWWMTIEAAEGAAGAVDLITKLR